jgi:hypothetical protein
MVLTSNALLYFSPASFLILYDDTVICFVISYYQFFIEIG